jgi:hypothetical protein
MILLTILGILLVIAASISEAIMDTIQFHYERSIFKFDPDKYKPLLGLGSLNIILAVVIARVLYGLVFTFCFDKVLIK